MEAYRRLAGCGSSKDLQQIRGDLSDVYGPVPAEVEELLDMTEARALAGRAGIESIVLIKGDIVFTVRDPAAARRVFEGTSGTVRMPDGHTAHWRLPPPYLQMPTLLRIVLKQLRQAAGEV
jgi:transcription-repair coupling factor (superfamily II helicase)